MRASEVNALYEEKYAGERLLTVGKTVPDVVRDGQGKHGWNMGGVQVHSSGKRVVVVGVLDNLLKGAATQCMQVSVLRVSKRFKTGREGERGLVRCPMMKGGWRGCVFQASEVFGCDAD